MKRKIALFICVVLTAVILLASAANAEWQKVNDWLYDSTKGQWEQAEFWQYFDEYGNKVESFEGMNRLEIPAEVDRLENQTLKGLGRDFVLEVEPGSYAETFAKEYGYQYDNGEKQVIGYNIKDADEKVQWIIDNYIEDNYQGRELTEEEKARVLHDWLVHNTAYNLYDLTTETEDVFWTSAILLRGRGVCNSYAQVYTLLLYHAGVESRYLIGDTDGDLVQDDDGKGFNHAWNLVLIDGQWYHVDTTWDNGDFINTAEDKEKMIVGSGEDSYVHFMATDEGIRAQSDHRAWDRDVSADSNVVGFIYTADGTYYYGTPGATATRTTGWVDYAANTYGQDYAATILYSPVYDPNPNEDNRVYQPDGRYYFDANGKMVRGWTKIEGDKYYFDANTGTLVKGWVDDGTDKYHTDDDGKIETGWQTLDGGFAVYNYKTNDWNYVHQFYFGDDGKMYTGWKKIGGEQYFFTRDGAMAVGWVADGDSTYHMADDGTLDTGWQILGGAYQYDPDTENWVWHDEGRYYFGNDGEMATGWKTIGGKRYYFGKIGNASTGWLEQDGSKYHMGDDGAADTGWKEMQASYLVWSYEANDWVETTSMYYFGTDGKMATGLTDVDKDTYFFDATTGEMLRDDVKRMKNRQGKERDYYFNKQGQMLHTGDVNGNKTVDGADAVRLMKYLKDENTDANETTADVDGNGITNQKDLQMLMDYFAGNVDSLD